MSYREIPARFSASAISSFSDCEQRFAYERLIKDVPLVPTPIQFIYGIVIHLAHERIWRHFLDKETPLLPNIVKYWVAFLKNVFDGVHGPAGESTPPKQIRWLTPLELVDLSDTEIQEKIKKKKDNYLAGAFLAVSAIYSDAARPVSFAKTEVEFNFTPKNVTIKIPSGLEYPLSGRMDRIHLWENGDYVIADVKTGAAHQTYQRNKLIRDIQMTLYQYVGEKLFGRRPKEMFIQPVRIFKKSQSLQEIRIPVEVREDLIHYQNLANLIGDVREVTDLVINADRHHQSFKNDWQPQSSWGRMARFTDNVRQGRFVPRIGSWCDSCPFVEECQRDNLSDWEAYQESKNPDISPTKLYGSSLVKRPRAPATLFDMGRQSARVRKSDRQIKKGMLASGEFVTVKEIPALVKKIHKLIPVKDSSPCPCRRLSLVPLSVLENFRSYKRGGLTIKQLIGNCPYRECPFREQPSDSN